MEASSLGPPHPKAVLSAGQTSPSQHLTMGHILLFLLVTPIGLPSGLFGARSPKTGCSCHQTTHLVEEGLGGLRPGWLE